MLMSNWCCGRYSPTAHFCLDPRLVAVARGQSGPETVIRTPIADNADPSTAAPSGGWGQLVECGLN